MAYNPTTWKDRIVERIRTYREQRNPDGTVTMIPAEGEVIQEGTPANAENLNKLEQGLADTSQVADQALATAEGAAAEVIRKLDVWQMMFGDGTDGDVTISGTVELTRDMNYRTLIVTSGSVVKTNGYRIRVADSVVVHGTVQNNASGSAGAPGGTIRGGAGAGNGTYFRDRACSLGGNGGKHDPSLSNPRAGGIAMPPHEEWFKNPFNVALLMATAKNSDHQVSVGQFALLSGGAAGGGGAYDGGGGGGVVVIAAPSVTVMPGGRLEAKGSVDQVSTSSGGGGGGIVLIYKTLTDSGAVYDVRGGGGYQSGSPGNVFKISLSSLFAGVE